ncbi:MAG: ABC transporter ATP-binding protein [Chitinophagales bacterium]|nr:MAG: ABC transporter ATP-binding protein [Chitinophagales bacterium]
MAVVALYNVSKSFNGKKVNDDLTFAVREHSVFGLLGPNGAGKTTLLRIITQILKADSGTILFNGQPLHPEHHSRIGYMPEERGLYRQMKVGEQLIYLARLKNLSRSQAVQQVDYWLDTFNIRHWRNKKIEELSKGMQQKIQFIATVAHKPELLILDEPFSGLDPLNTNQLKAIILQLKEQGTAIIFSTHRMEQVEEICEDILLIHHGRNILLGRVDAIRQRFKENKYLLNFAGQLHPELGQKFCIESARDHELIIRLQPGQSPNDLLRFCLDYNTEVHQFKEILPTLNEIFINQVASIGTDDGKNLAHHNA